MIAAIIWVSLSIQGGKSGAGSQTTKVSSDGSVRTFRTSIDGEVSDQKESKTKSAAAIMKSAAKLGKLKESYENDRTQSHWNTFAITISDGKTEKRVIVEGGSTEKDPALAEYFKLVEALAALSR